MIVRSLTVGVGLFVANAAFAAPVFTSTGTCPGVTNLMVTGGTPNQKMAFITGTLGGSTTLAQGPCAGTVIDLGNITLRSNANANGAGERTLSPNLGANSCSVGGQWLDVNTCTVSNAMQLGPTCTTSDSSWTDTAPVLGPPFEADPVFFAMWTETSVASGLREDWEIEDPLGNIPVPATLVVDFLDGAFALQCSVFLDISHATVDAAYTASSINALGMVAGAVAVTDGVFVTVSGGFTDCLELDPAGALAILIGSTDIRNFVWGDWGMGFNMISGDLSGEISAAVGAAAYAADWDPFVFGASFLGLETNYDFNYDRTCEVVEVDPVTGFFVELNKPVGPVTEHEASNPYWVFGI